MKGTLLFVHGTGVREHGHSQLLKTVTDGCHRNGFAGIDIVGCPWGEAAGVTLDRLADTLPEENLRAADETSPDPEHIDAATWALLIEDPLFELRLAAQSGTPASAQINVGGTLPSQDVITELKGLRAKPVKTEQSGIPFWELADAAERVARFPEIAAAAAAAGSATDSALVHSLARAIVASVISSHRADFPGTVPRAIFASTDRDNLVTALEAALAPDQRDVGDWIRRKVVEFAKARASAMARSRREFLTGLSLPAVGDILLYQRRGQRVSKVVAEAVKGLDRPVVAVGHSLGGIILVDLLSRPAEKIAPVDLLVTVGSQSPLFFVIDALETLRPSEKLRPFTPWINIYDRNDLLSYLAGRVFGEAEGIVDEEISAGVPFPEAHSAYFYQDRTYTLLRERWPTGT